MRSYKIEKRDMYTGHIQAMVFDTLFEQIVPASQMNDVFVELLARLYNEPRGERPNEQSVCVCSWECDKSEGDNENICCSIEIARYNPEIIVIITTKGYNLSIYTPTVQAPKAYLLDKTIFPKVFPGFPIKSMIYINKDRDSEDYVLPKAEA
jgi:hypothetical protein